MKNTIFLDSETGELVTVEQLETEFNSLRSEQPEEYDYTFSEYIRNCLTRYNGTLEIVRNGRE